MYSAVGNNINAIRTHLGLTQGQLATHLGVSQTTISAWETGISQPRENNLKPLYELMSGLTHDDIWGEEKGFAMKALKNGSHREDGSIPVMGSISDEQRFVLFPEAEKIDMREQLSTRYPHSFFLHVFGESMNRVFPNDCLILIDHLQREVIDGEIYAVRINSSQATVRRARRAGAKLELIPDSWDSSYETIELDWAPDNPDGGQVLGRMVWCCPPPGKKL